LNADIMICFIPPVIAVITGLPSFSHDRTQFRSAVTTKLVQRFGLLEETIATDLGSTVSTKNLAYDANTGDVLLTQTSQDFNDPVYALTFPAYWFYDGMGPTSKNLGAVLQNQSVNSTGLISLNGANSIFVEGDELAMYASSSSAPVKAWVSKSTPTSLNVIDRQGNNFPAATYAVVKIVRSGHRNQQSSPMAQLTTLTNPLQSLSSNAYSKVVQASAIEYTNDWKTYCDCFEDGSAPPNSPQASTNPYVIGRKGYWKPKRSFTYLTDRTQAKYDNNTNIRRDGIFTAFTPFYKWNAGKWIMDEPNWTYTSEVTLFSPFGPELENMDALGKFSAATFGFNQTLSTAVSANARYRDIGFDSFEDYGFSTCADNHFKVSPPSSVPPKISHTAHTGRNSLKVAVGDSVVISRQLAAICDIGPCDPSVCYSYYPAMGNLVFIMGSLKQTCQIIGPYSIDYTITGGANQKNVVSTVNGLNVTGTFVNGESFALDLDLTLSDGRVVHKHLVVHVSSGGAVTVDGIPDCARI